MAQDNRFDPARLERIERRLQVLEDGEAIRNLKARYAGLCDNQYDADEIASLFTEDAVWEQADVHQRQHRRRHGFFSLFPLHWINHDRISRAPESRRKSRRSP